MHNTKHAGLHTQRATITGGAQQVQSSASGYASHTYCRTLRSVRSAVLRPSSSGRLNGQRRRQQQPLAPEQHELEAVTQRNGADDGVQPTSSASGQVTYDRGGAELRQSGVVMRNSKATSTALPNSTTQHLAEVAVQENQPRLRRDRHQNSRVRRVMQPAAAEVVPEGSAQTEFPPSMHVAVLLQQLQERLAAGVRMEEEESRQAGRDMYNRGTERQLKNSGVVLSGLRARKEEKALFGDPVWMFAMSAGAELPFHRFAAGDAVILSAKLRTDSMSQTKSDGDLITFEGILLAARRSHVSIVIDAEHADSMDDIRPAALRWRVDKTVSSTTTRRELSAIEDLGDLELTEAALRVRLATLGGGQSSQLAVAPNAWARDTAWRRDAWEALSTSPDVNRSQQRAVLAAAFSTFTLWQGPPGTGKTRALLALMKTLSALNKRSSRYAQYYGTILSCAGTNAAADNLAEGLIAAGVHVVRVGQPAKVRPGLQAVTLDALTAHTDRGRRAAKQLETALQVIDFASAVLAKGETDQSGRSTARPKRLPVSSVQGALLRHGMTVAEARKTVQQARRERDRARQLFRDAYTEVLDRAQVIVATCAGAGGPELRDRSFRMVVIDEATQATEPSTLIPLVKGAQCVVLAGDPLQLPPTILSRRAGSDFGLSRTLFERLQACGVKSLLLDTQYRMHKGIAEFPSRAFYESALQTGVDASERPAPKGFPWPVPGLPVALLPCEHGFEEVAAGAQDLDTGAKSSGKSYRNVAEAELAVRAMSLLLAAGDIQSAAILTPYNGQLRLIRQLIRKAAPALSAVEVATVDGFQGRESDVVVFSAVRCNTRGAVGFLADPRRLNVALTRPRRGLVVIASPKTISHDKTWWAWVQWAQDAGVVCEPLSTSLHQQTV